MRVEAKQEMNELGPKDMDKYRRFAEINRAITTSLDFDQVLDLITRNANQLLGARMSVLVLSNREELLAVRSAWGVDPSLVGSLLGPIEEDVIPKLHQSLKIAPEETLVSVPVIAQQAVRGMLVVACPAPANDEALWQLSALADQASIALQNARLHQMELDAAKQKRDETLEALSESNRRITRILSSITDLFYTLDREWRFTDVNTQTERRLGKTRDELIGNVIWDVFPLAVESSLYPQFHAAIEDMQPRHFELLSKIVPGVWFEANAYPAETGLTVYLRDITERKHRESLNHLLVSIVESSDDAIISKDLNGIINSWNTGAENIFGYKADEVIGKSVTVLIPEDRFDEEPTILGQIRRGIKVDHYETIRRRKDGSLIDISLTVSPIKDETGEIIGASKIARDITSRKQAQEEILFQAHLLNAVEEAVIATDLNGVVEYWNSFAEKLYGWSPHEALGASIFDLVSANMSRTQAAGIFDRLRQGESWSGEILLQRKDGSEFPAFVTDSPIHNNRGELVGVVGVSIDISERKRIENERARLLAGEKEARAQAEQANRVKDEFLATLSHELRNPLNVILGYSEVLLRSDEAKQSQFVKRAAETLKRNALSQSQLVRDLLDLSRLHMGKLSLNIEAVSLNSTIANAIDTVRAESEAKNLCLEVHMPDEVIFVEADTLRIEQVIWNLLNNAVKFTPQGGRIIVDVNRDDANALVSSTLR